MAEKLESRHSLEIRADKSPPATTQPDLQGHRKLIRIRPYKPSDSEQVHELFVAGIVHGRMLFMPVLSLFLIFLFLIYLAQSPLQQMYSTQLKGPTACVSYCAIILGILLATRLTSEWIRYIGIALSISGFALFTFHRYTSLGNLQKAWEGGIKDIGKTFEMKPVINPDDERAGEYAPSGISGFWVAEAYELKGSEIDDSRTKIVGSLGLLQIGIFNHHSISRSSFIF